MKQLRLAERRVCPTELPVIAESSFQVVADNAPDHGFAGVVDCAEMDFL
jgi:hypothetical protein